MGGSNPVVVVQGTYVADNKYPTNTSYPTSSNYNYNSGASNYNSGASIYPSAQIYGNSDPTYNNSAMNPEVSNYTKGTKQVSRCRDPIFALLLIGNVAAITIIAAVYGYNPFRGKDGTNSSSTTSSTSGNYQAAIYTALGCGVVALGLSLLMFLVLICIPSILIKTSLILNLLYSAGIAFIGFYSGSLAFGILGAVLFALTLCYTYFVWSRIPFATANLVTATTAIRSNFGVVIVAYFMVALAAGWSILWVAAVSGISNKLMTCPSSSSSSSSSSTTAKCEITGAQYGYLFLLFLSYFFTHQVLQNSVQTIVSGVVGTWWFTPSEANCCCSSAIFGSLIRTMTTSFGSVCFGSLLVAIVQALRQIANMARNNQDANGLLVCCAQCILGCLESLLEYFNKWAFVYVGLYGYSYIEAGKNVITLFKNRGWEAIIADNLVGTTMFFLSLAVGLITGAVGILFVTQTNWWDTFANTAGDKKIIAFIIGLIVGIVICSILLSTIVSGTDAVIVCFAEGPAEFEANHPKLSADMRRAWNEVYPGSC